ncbi:MAG: terpene cyclase/mutase family protein [Gemmataceae bacterium]|nr:terpene cyclase/mutase family protein [Gemmataceae bacterium]
MDRRLFLSAVAAGAAGSLGRFPLPGAAAQEAAKKADVEAAVERGLDNLKKIQAQDGHWEAPGGQYATSVTGVAGLALLMEGSTLREGKYSDQVQKAVTWYLHPRRTRANGLIGDADNPSESQRYMYGQGFGTLFLASVYGEEEDGDQRKKLEAVLTKAVDFICKAQTSKRHRRPEGKEVEVGGWGYVSAADGQHFDEGSVTITALQALRAARNAGIKVPKEAIDKAVAYLEACTTPDGGIIYSYAGSGGAAAQAGQGRPPLTAAAICCGFSAGQYKSELPKKWIAYCKKNIPVAKGRVPHEEYMMYYYAQAMYALGDDRYGELFPNEPKDQWLTWTRFKEAMYPYLLGSQDKASGGWTGSGSYGIGPAFVTAINLTILQLDKNVLPIYQR